MKLRTIIALLLLGLAVVMLLVLRRPAPMPPQIADRSEGPPVRQNDAAAEVFQRELIAARNDAAAAEQKTRALAGELATNRQSAKPPPNPLQDPAMRQMMEKQQAQALDRRVKQLVNAELRQKLQLNPDQAAQLRELIKRKQLPAVKLLTAVMGGDLDPDAIAAMGVHVKEERSAVDTEIKALLGKEGYDYFDWYDRSDPERSRIRDLKSQFADAGQPLSADQQQELLNVMYEARLKFKFTIDYNDPGAFDYTRLQDYFNEDNMNRFFAEMEQLNNQTVVRAQGILAPDQLAEFERLQQEHLERGKTTVRMTQAMFPMKKSAP